MEKRTGIRDALTVFTVFSGIILIDDVINRRKSIAEARARHETTKGRLKKIESSLEELHARLGKKR